MKIFNIDTVIENEIKALYKFTDGKPLQEEDKFALFMNLVRSGKYNDKTLKQLYYKIIKY